MRIARFLTWTCLAMALASTSLAQTAPAPAPAPGAPAPAAAPAPAPAPATAAPPVTADPYGAAPADPAAAPAPAPQPAPVAQPAPAPAPAPAPVYTAAPAPAPQPATPAYPEEEAEEDEGDCALGTFCFGPVLTLGVLNPLGIGIHGRISEQFGFGLDYQFLPSVGVGDVSAGISLFTLTGRWHPGGSSFFLGAGFSYQSFYAEGSVEDATGTSASIDASVGIPQLMLGLGVLGGSGFVMGIDLAFGIPLGSADVEFNSDMPEGNDELEAMYDSQKKDIEDFAETMLELLPATFQLNLIRIGYIF